MVIGLEKLLVWKGRDQHRYSYEEEVGSSYPILFIFLGASKTPLINFKDAIIVVVNLDHPSTLPLHQARSGGFSVADHFTCVLFYLSRHENGRTYLPEEFKGSFLLTS